jgi:hypothetical protein
MPPEVETQPEVHFCFKCGRRVDPSRTSCWYCGSTTRRTIRPPKKCSFCGSMIPSDAIKCRHCGEFLDGRKAEAPPPPPTQIVYIVDRRLLQTTADRRLLPGEPIPREVALRLSGPTLRAIEQNRPELLDDPMVQALPAPESSAGGTGGKVLDIGGDVVARPGGEMIVGGRKRPAKESAPEREDSSEALPARRQAEAPSRLEETPQQAGRGRGGLLMRMLGGIGRFLLRTAPGARPRPEAGPIDVEPEERYRNCGKCGTEILASDNYCFHCGMQYHQSKIDLKEEIRIERRVDNTGIYVLALILCAGLWWTAGRREAVPPMTRPILAGATILLAAIGFFRKRTSVSQFVSLAIAAGAAVLLVFF